MFGACGLISHESPFNEKYQNLLPISENPFHISTFYDIIGLCEQNR